VARNYPNWLGAFVDYASYTESPKLMHFWAGVGTIAGALRRKVWFDQVYFRWYPSFYIIFVAPPGVVSKSTTAEIGTSLLREVPGIKFGPDSVTWQQLVTSFAASCESYEVNGEWHSMSAITLVASEFGNLIDFQDKQMVNIFIDLWDGRKSFEKQTKFSGSDVIDSPWINMLACTTPAWISDNMSNNVIGGGFTSRCIFIYADKKERYSAYLKSVIPTGMKETRLKLIQDLEHIALRLAGEYVITPEAEQWGVQWYESMWKNSYSAEATDFHNGWIARKQTHLHKLAMIIAAAQRDELLITADDLKLADIMLAETEKSHSKVFSRIGRTEDSLEVERFMQLLRYKKEMPYADAVKMLYTKFTDFKQIEGILAGAIRSGYMTLIQKGNDAFLKWSGD